MVSWEKNVRVSNWNELLPTGEHHRGLKRSDIWTGPNGMTRIYTFGKELKVKGQNIIKKEQRYGKLSCGRWITFYFIAESHLFISRKCCDFPYEGKVYKPQL